MARCQCDKVIKCAFQCQFMADTDECLKCFKCDIHFHAPKGTRKSDQERPIPWRSNWSKEPKP